MKKPAEKTKRKKSPRKRVQTGSPPQAAVETKPRVEALPEESAIKGEAEKKTPPPVVKKDAVRRTEKKTEKKKDSKLPISRYFSMAVQFFKEARVELKKVKWPTRKELLASTAVVIFLALLVAVYLGIVDFGLIKIIRLVVG